MDGDLRWTDLNLECHVEFDPYDPAAGL